MNKIRGTEWLLLVIMSAYVLFIPFTKVEESFNIQAIHDLLYHRQNISQYDHLEFPGVVPRTFIGAIANALPVVPFIRILEWWNAPKYFTLIVARIILGAANLIAFCNFARCVEQKFGELTGEFLRLLTASQFHLIFYSSRPLPNTFALFSVLLVYEKLLNGNWKWGIRLAVVATLLFRCELALLFSCIFFYPIISRKVSLLGWNGVLVNTILATLISLGISVPIDSMLWNRWLWPEGEVLWFNIILNRSHEYGVSPFLWYFYSAVPRALMFSAPFVPFGLLFDRRTMPIVFPVFIFVFLYSFLPHKELRFIIYSFPVFNLSAAIVLTRLWINRWKSMWRFILATLVVFHFLLNIACTGVYTSASSRNYPGGEALTYLQHIQRSKNHMPISVHIDVYAAQTGINRFLEFYPAWELVNCYNFLKFASELIIRRLAASLW